MKRIKPWLKVASVVSAVLLVAALIAYRAGAFEWLPYYKARMFSSSKSYNFDVPLPPANTAPIGTQATEAEPNAAPLQFTGKPSGTSELMGSSKSAYVIRAEPPQEPPAATKPPTIMPGSKSSFFNLIPPDKLKKLPGYKSPAPTKPTTDSK